MNIKGHFIFISEMYALVEWHKNTYSRVATYTRLSSEAKTNLLFVAHIAVF